MLSDIDRFLTLTGVSASRFGRDALNDPRFVFDLRNGREPRGVTARKILAIVASPVAESDAPNPDHPSTMYSIEDIGL